MRRWLEAVDRFYYAPAPPERLAAVRLLVGSFAVIYLLATAPKFLAVSRFSPQDFAPVGPLAWLHGPFPASVISVALVLCVLTGIAFTLGLAYSLSAPAFALLLLFVTTYRSSWGMKFHTENLLTLHVLLLAAAPAASSWSWPRRRGQQIEPSAPQAHGRYGWALRAMSLVTVITYVLAGIAKWRNGGWDWLSGELLREHIAYDVVRKIELGSIHSPLGAAMVEAAWTFPLLGWFTMAVELLAPLALLGGRPARIWVALAWSFHVGVLLTMAISFAYPLSLVAYATLLPAEKVRELPIVRKLLPPAAIGMVVDETAEDTMAS
jgi:hypothetical protein